MEGDGTWLDRALYSVLMAGIDLKAFALFSLLFGAGLAIQYDHLSAHSRRTVLLVRRLAFLMLIGAAHLVLIWNGDILFEYAIAGFVVLPFLYLSIADTDPGGNRPARGVPRVVLPAGAGADAGQSLDEAERRRGPANLWFRRLCRGVGLSRSRAARIPATACVRCFRERSP